MEQRVLGRRRLMASAPGHGAGAVGGPTVRGNPARRRRSPARAVEAGITHVGAAPLRGNGRGGRNPGRALAAFPIRQAALAPGMGCALIGAASVEPPEAAIAPVEEEPPPLGAEERMGAVPA